MKITEENFIDELKKRNERALEYVIDNHTWIIKTVLKKHLYHLMDFYEECMNDCLLAIWENIHYYNPKKSTFKNWVGGIAKYKSIDYIRKYLKNMENQNIEEAIIAVEDQSLKEVLINEVREETEKILSTLSEKDQIIFKKLYLQDKNIDEVSQDMGLSKSVLYNRISRGKKKLRDKINMQGGYKSE
ncbi:sigma-70 family RNA polymerase sigma factor [Geosporobacter ferrireducens]|uniref:RNA polymerase subunit sigma-70 n=1 Tax=Geosporobacter ferrireducens TaxID=1424294 RepID=A0A1D8GKK3_9FIRM|nr:sigma-70 family RNA polymerase sigma factor [Geosporobacter ferrireducens]AOT71445.1 RNA polymerase subunit sigma-70 [Geosporobacter ferrireducens]MTI57751.1 sigma-70 family RNA polymerase sigma factor [Geosporobacter ferrireducens]